MKVNSKKNKFICLTLASVIFVSSCTSTTLIQSIPSGAKIYIDEERVGTTPYYYSDSKISGSVTNIKIEKEGYAPFNTIMSKDEAVDVGAIVGGCFVLIPFLWTMKYKPIHQYELTPLTQEEQPIIKNTTNPDTKTTVNKTVTTKSKVDRLRELKQLYEEKLITLPEYEKQKQKILEEIEN